MIARYAILAAAAAPLLVAVPADAGPCTDRIYQTDVAIEKLLDAAAAQGEPGVESTFATMHRQPTPRSVAGAETRAGDLSPDQTQKILDAMELARKADDAGDQAGCEKALGEAQHILNP
jgi:hypothetical protein